MARQYLVRAVVFAALVVYWLIFFNDVIWPYCSEYSGGYVAIPEGILQIIAILVPVIVWIIYTIRFFQKPLRYLDELIQASEQLAMHKEQPIQLSGFLQEAAKSTSNVIISIL